MTKLNVEYQCPRCGYSSSQKGHIRKHFFTLKKICPALKKDIELTETVKEYVLANRIWTPKEESQDALQQQQAQQSISIQMHHTINNYQMIYNMLGKMSVVDKIQKYNDYKSIELMDLEDTIEDAYCVKARQLDRGKQRHCHLDNTALISLVDSVTTMQDIDKFNIVYDEMPNKLRIFTSGQWRAHLFEAGVKEILEKIQGCYLDFYECFLLRKYYTVQSPLERTQLREHIEDYYKFIACFDMIPYVKAKNNNEILYSINDEKHHEQVPTYDISNNSIQDEWYQRFKHIKTSLMLSEANRTRKDVFMIVKRNTKSNVIDLNKKVMEIIQMDDDFKKDVLNGIMCIVCQNED
jgi:hypothetical protein